MSDRDAAPSAPLPTATPPAPWKGPAPAPAADVSLRLSAMMFLQWAVPGLYVPILARYLTSGPDKGGLGLEGWQTGMVFGIVPAIGAVAAPFIAGQVADRYLNAERAMAVLLLIGGAAQLGLSRAGEFGLFLALAIASSLAFAPMAALSNSVCFHSLTDKDRQFPRIRAWGTIGWVVAGMLFGSLWLNRFPKEEQVRHIADALAVSGLLAILYAGYCLFVLPRTPPRKNVQHPLAFMRAFSLFQHPGFLVLAMVALPIAMVHTCYFIRAAPFLRQEIGVPDSLLPHVMGIGQMSEVFFLAMLPLFLRRLGYRGVLAVGGFSYVLRYTIFAIGSPDWLVIAAQSLHGLCFGCFYAGAFLYTEKVAPPDIRHSAQMVLGMVLALGATVGGFYNGYFDRFKKPDPAPTVVMTQPAGAASPTWRPLAAEAPAPSPAAPSPAAASPAATSPAAAATQPAKLPQDFRQFWWSNAAVALAATLALLALFPRRDSESVPSAAP